MTELLIPDTAITALYRADPGKEVTGDARDEAIARAIATPVVAAELRRMADYLAETYSPDTPQIHTAMASVRARADELDSQGGEHRD